MSSLVRWDPFREMLSMRNTMDRLVESALLDQPGWRPSEWDLALDVAENENEYVVKGAIPGINPDDLDITFTNNTLTIRGETKAEHEKEDVRYHLRERRFGSFARSLSLPSPIQSDAIQASYDAGVLTLRLPKAEEAKPKRIAIQVGNGQSKMIDHKAK